MYMHCTTQSLALLLGGALKCLVQCTTINCVGTCIYMLKLVVLNSSHTYSYKFLDVLMPALSLIHNNYDADATSIMSITGKGIFYSSNSITDVKINVLII